MKTDRIFIRPSVRPKASNPDTDMFVGHPDASADVGYEYLPRMTDTNTICSISAGYRISDILFGYIRIIIRINIRIL
jgi:hypothetical protein